MELESSRLSLRRLDRGDTEAIGRMFADPAVTRHLAVGSLSDAREVRQFAEAFIAKSREEFAGAGCGAMAVVGRRGDLLGYCGLRPLPDVTEAVELLYALAPRFWGLGLATEAAGLTLSWGFATLAITEVVGLAAPENVGSRRVMEKLGMGYAGTTSDYYDAELALYCIRRDAAEQVAV